MTAPTLIATPTAATVAALTRPTRPPTYSPDPARFADLAREHDLVPVWRDLPADIDTPVSVLLRLRGREAAAPAFLLESVERGDTVGRYSFIGDLPSALIETRGHEVTSTRDGQTETRPIERDPLDEVRRLLGGRSCARVAGLPLFVGGAVGFLGWDCVRFFERLPAPTYDTLGLPDSAFMLVDTFIAFDHVQRRMKLVALAHVGRPSTADRPAADDGPRTKDHDGSQTAVGGRRSAVDVEAAYAAAVERIEALAARLRRPLPELPEAPGSVAGAGTTSNFTQAEYEAKVEVAKEYIRAGDAFQIVLAQRRQRRTEADPLSIYRALRMLNPSPYMFFLDFGGYQLIGSSPEMQVRLTDGLAEMHPIAGTRPRGATPEADEALAHELLHDVKERAEHVMLVDLARNDLGRVCTYGSVRVPQLMTVERYSHVMHIVSHAEGQLAPGRDAFDLVRATFPAGTLSGAPKIRAMEIINELEGLKRGPYGGVVGYFGFDGNMDTCITIRTVVLAGGVASMQAGGGIVADSDPTAEYHESLNKLKAVERAVEIAENGLE